MAQAIVLSGPIGVGKSKFGEAMLELVGGRRVSTSNWIIRQTGAERERSSLQAAGERLDRETGGSWVADAIQADFEENGDGVLMLDSVRTAAQIAALRDKIGTVNHIHLDASDQVLESRYLNRPPENREFATYAEVRRSSTEAAVGELKKIADLVLDTDYANPHILAGIAAAVFGSPRKRPASVVDVIVGGQYGSEGKGNICAAIATQYGGLCRVGGPNAGHLVKHPPYKYVQLPSGTQSNLEARIFIAAGSTIFLPQLLTEIYDCRLDATRLFIDPQAMIIDDEDRRLEDALQSISSTRQGVGSALARKILNRGEKPLFGPKVQLARDIKQLAKYVRDVRAELDQMVADGTPILIEGTQGTALSIHHGIWPSVTSRETSASGCLADAGIAPKAVRRVLGVYRTYPIRVGGTSGWMGREIKLGDVSDRSGIPFEEMQRTERGTISGTERRIAEFDWALFQRSVALNGVTDIALTFADYLRIDNRKASTFDELTADTRDFIGRLERVAGAPVNLVAKAFEKDGVLRRGGW